VKRQEAMSDESKIRIRRAKKTDAKALAELAGQLGYPTTESQMTARLRGLKPSALHAVFVADAPGRGVIGWLHVSVSKLIEVELRAEVNGLVVGEAQRSSGAGALLLKAAEEWASRRGCRGMSVRSNVIRERAHKFYERNGYEHYKTQKAFRKALSQAI
jgi:GNAT superfamily N-acetyltransferase